VPVRVYSFDVSEEKARSLVEFKNRVDHYFRELVEENPLYRNLLEIKRNEIVQRVRQFNLDFAWLPNAEIWRPDEVMACTSQLLRILNEVLMYQKEICGLIRVGAPNI
jgi:hypothetical protein